MSNNHPDPVEMEEALLVISTGHRPSRQSIGRQVKLRRSELRKIAEAALLTEAQSDSGEWHGPKIKSMENALRAISRGIRPDTLLVVRGKILNCYQLMAIARTALPLKNTKQVVAGLYWKPPEHQRTISFEEEPEVESA